MTRKHWIAIGVVVVAAGEGLINVFRSLGATGVVEGGQTVVRHNAYIGGSPCFDSNV